MTGRIMNICKTLHNKWRKAESIYLLAVFRLQRCYYRLWNDKVAFRNSKRAKIKGNSDEVVIYEMSEIESGLPAILRYPGMKAHLKKWDMH